MEKKIVTMILGISLLTFILAGCPDSPPDEIKPAGAITIANIPQFIDAAEMKPTYKVYVSMSDSTSDQDPHKAQGVKVLTATDFTNGKATVTVDLYAPPTKVPGVDPDPDDHGGPWSGESNNFSVTICPQGAAGSTDIIVKAGMGFKEQKKNWDWTSGMLDLKQLGMKEQVNAIYTRIICNDKTTDGTGIITGVEWKREDNKISFVLADDLSFCCYLTKALGSPITVTGKLSNSEPGLGTDEYTMGTMSTDNNSIKTIVESFNDTKVKLVYTANKKQFTFSSDDTTVQNFFGGKFTKVE